MEFRTASHRVVAWFAQQRQKALDAAYEGALTIRRLEDDLFAGEKIADAPDKSKTVADYAASLRDRQLLKIRFNLAQFKANSFLFEAQRTEASPPETADGAAADASARPSHQAVLDKLELIESVIAKYRDDAGFPLDLGGDAEVMAAEATSAPEPARYRTLDLPTLQADSDRSRETLLSRLRSPNKDKGGDYEQQIIDTLRLQRRQNRIAMRWLAILLLVPLAVQLLTKNLIFEPLLGHYSDRNPTSIELNQEIREEFAQQYLLAKEKLEVATLLGLYKDMNEERRQEYLQETAFDLWREAREEELNGLKNLLADAVALLTFIGLALIGRRQVAIIRIALNRTFLNLRDPVKVFLFILITDIFVGYHSAEGWEVILEGMLRHFGQPESKVFINGFIATVPVMIDASIKFWIFNYLTRYSPATSAIYERMNT